MKHSDDWFKSEKDYSWVAGAILLGGLIMFGLIAVISIYR